MKKVLVSGAMALGLLFPHEASAIVATTCTEAFNNCMSGGVRARKNYDGAEQGARCKRLQAVCMRTGNWKTQFQTLTGLGKT